MGHKFRGDRDTKKDISPNRFRLSSYLSKAESMEKAVKEGERFETDKFRKAKFSFRDVDPLKASTKGFQLHTTT